MLQICKKLSNHDDCKIKVRTLKEKLCGNKKNTQDHHFYFATLNQT